MKIVFGFFYFVFSLLSHSLLHDSRASSIQTRWLIACTQHSFSKLLRVNVEFIAEINSIHSIRRNCSFGPNTPFVCWKSIYANQRTERREKWCIFHILWHIREHSRQSSSALNDDVFNLLRGHAVYHNFRTWKSEINQLTQYPTQQANVEHPKCVHVKSSRMISGFYATQAQSNGNLQIEHT